MTPPQPKHQLPGGLLHQHGRDLSRLQRLLDPVLVLGAFALAQSWAGPVPQAETLSVLMVLLTSLLLPVMGLYQSYRQRTLWSLLRRLSLGWFYVVAALLLVSYLTKSSAAFSREVMLIWAGLSWGLLCAAHLLLRRWLRWQRTLGRNTRNAVFWGLPHQAEQFTALCTSSRYLGIIPVRWFGPLAPAPASPGAVHYGGSLKTFSEYLQQHTPDLIYLGDTDPRQMEQVLQLVGNSTRPVFYLPGWARTSMTLQSQMLGGQVALALWQDPKTPMDRTLKRAGDLLLASLALVVLAPLLLAIALAVRLTSPGPVLFRQRRYGLDGREFRVCKFRTMTVLEDGDQVTQARRQDQRLTPIGGFLRRWSLDELPQLLNVLEGSMSLVGPRPHAVAHNELYRQQIDGYMLRHMLKPGITGLAQVEGHRGETPRLEMMHARIQADLRYLREWSLALDLKILVQTALRLASPQAY